MEQVCPWCGLACPPTQYLAHILTHAPAGGGREKKKLQEHVCKKCGKSYQHEKSLKRHVREAHSEKSVACDKCGKVFRLARCLRKHRESKRDCRKKMIKCRKCPKRMTLCELVVHRKTAHPSPSSRLVCAGCGRKCRSRCALLLHASRCGQLEVRRGRVTAYRDWLKKHPSGVSSPVASPPPEWDTKTAVEGNARVHLLDISDDDDLQLCLIKNKQHIARRLTEDMTELKRIKWYLVAWIQVNRSVESEGLTETFYLRCPPLSTLQKGDIESQIRTAIPAVLTSFDTATAEGSLILFERVSKIELRVAKLELLRGSSYLPLPKWLQHSRKGLINIQNFNDNFCFLYCILAGLQLPASHPERVSHYKERVGEVNMTGISYPVKISSLNKFEDLNPHISVSVFGVEGHVIVPIRVTRAQTRVRHINLLLIKEGNGDKDGDADDEDDDADDFECHYIYIKDLSALLSSSIKRNKRQFWCDNCLNPYDSPALLADHRVKCVAQNAQCVIMPKGDDSVMRFSEHQKQMWHDYVIYCDLESVLEPYHCALPNPERSSTTVRNRHVPCGYCYIVKGPNGYQEPVLERGSGNIIKRLLIRLREEVDAIMEERGPQYPIIMTAEDEESFQSAVKCYLCNANFAETGKVKCRDHHHHIDNKTNSSNYAGPSCQGCNLNRKRSDFVPVFFHNGSNYDMHMIISAIGLLSDGADISCIPKNKERYVSVQWGKLRFLDSFNFLNSSLDKLVSDLKKDELEGLDLFFPDPEKRALVERKGVYPYNYFDSFEKFEETELPPIEAFHSDLTGKGISSDDYNHAKNVFKVFNMSNLGEFHDLYLFTDTLLLSCVFEQYRKVTFHNFKLDPVHYYTTPGLSWSAALLYTGQELELLQDLDMHLMFEAGIRGGVATINCRSSTANNPYILPTYDPLKESVYIMYLDANNLYGLALSRPLPTGGFRMLTQDEIKQLDISKIKVDDSDGYLFDVSLEYGDHLHDLHNDLPLAPEKYVPQYDELSPLQQRMHRKYEVKDVGMSKLIPNLHDKKNYVVYGTTLKLYVELGLKIKCVHRVMTFEQKAWLAPFIQHNTQQRQKATSNFQKNLWKLYNNSCFGKTIEQVRKRRDVVFTKTPKKFRKLVRSPLFHSFEIFDHGLVCVERKKARVVLNRPVYAGQVVLDVSKEWMFNFHFKTMKARYGDHVKMLAHDTDSFLYEIRTADIYKDMEQMSSHFDFSDYPIEHPLYSIENKKVPGKMKDEMNGRQIQSFIGLRPKMYAFLQPGGAQKCVGKGVPRASLQAQLKFADYQTCLQQMSVKSVQYTKISTDRKHHLFTTASTKRALTCYDDKRYILADNKNTLGYGHYRIRKGLCTDPGNENLQQLLCLMEEEEEEEDNEMEVE